MLGRGVVTVRFQCHTLKAVHDESCNGIPDHKCILPDLIPNVYGIIHFRKKQSHIHSLS